MNYKIINTGSDGNATIIEDTILIDCGVSFKKLQEYYKNLKLVLLTHIHSDHFNKTTIKRLAEERPTLRFACCEWLVQDLVDCGVSKQNIDIYDFNNTYIYSELLMVETFKLTHDVPNCGYKLKVNNYKYFYATDTSCLDNIQAKNYDMYFIEGNYEDENELEKRKQEHIDNGEFYYEDRVEETHLSKVKAMDFLMTNMSDNSQFVFMHEHKEKKEGKNEIRN